MALRVDIHCLGQNQFLEIRCMLATGWHTPAHIEKNKVVTGCYNFVVDNLVPTL